VDCKGNQFGKDQARKNLENLESIFSQLKQVQGIQILRQDEYLEAWLGKKDSN